MTIAKAKHVRGILNQIDELDQIEEILKNYDATVKVAVSSEYNSNKKNRIERQIMIPDVKQLLERYIKDRKADLYKNLEEI